MKTEKSNNNLIKSHPISAAILEIKKEQPLVRNRNSHARVVVQLAIPPEDSLTQQQFKDECDINRIVQNAQRGIAPKYLARGTPQYGDFSNVPDLPQAYEKIRKAEEAFMNLPAQLRLELNNDPAQINRLTDEQIKRYKLDKDSARTNPPSQPPQPSDAPPVATPDGRALDTPDPKPGSKKSAKSDS